jgi:hypothetical protein
MGGHTMGQGNNDEERAILAKMRNEAEIADEESEE